MQESCYILLHCFWVPHIVEKLSKGARISWEDSRPVGEEKDRRERFADRGFHQEEMCVNALLGIRIFEGGEMKMN